jgi:dTDP-4-dehydrorhamnose 3,5-epimerase
LPAVTRDNRQVHNLGSRQDRPSATPDWTPAQPSIEGVRTKEVRNIVKPRGDVLCEIFRRDWLLDQGEVDQVFQSVMLPGSISAWHVHHRTIDRLFVSHGLALIVLYDGRKDSPTYQQLTEFRFGTIRPALLCVPPGVWHGVQNISSAPAVLLNLVDKAYEYDDPDHWRLPPDTDKIPYRFE